MSVNNPNYGEMLNNPICLDIPWYNPDPAVLERLVFKIVYMKNDF